MDNNGTPEDNIGISEAYSGDEQGSVTAELAVALPAVVLLLITIIAIGAAFGTQIRVSDAARTGARLYALGHPREHVTTTIRALAGSDATASFTSDGQWATIDVTRSLAIGPANLGVFQLSGSAVVWLEP